jgi:hypothetical protein
MHRQARTLLKSPWCLDLNWSVRRSWPASRSGATAPIIRRIRHGPAHYRLAAFGRELTGGGHEEEASGSDVVRDEVSQRNHNRNDGSGPSTLEQAHAALVDGLLVRLSPPAHDSGNEHTAAADIDAALLEWVPDSMLDAAIVSAKRGAVASRMNDVKCVVVK